LLLKDLTEERRKYENAIYTKFKRFFARVPCCFSFKNIIKTIRREGGELRNADPRQKMLLFFGEVVAGSEKVLGRTVIDVLMVRRVRMKGVY
jgi:hypothetical protein